MPKTLSITAQRAAVLRARAEFVAADDALWDDYRAEKRAAQQRGATTTELLNIHEQYKRKLAPLRDRYAASQKAAWTKGNPPGRRVKIASHVQAIAYVHAKDGDKYVHGFGDADLDESELKRGVLNLDDLNDRTHVEAYGNADGTVTLCPTSAHALVGFFPD
jgi:hypothetical protein